eukprot:11128-Heterococcus_DN1.PRE.7
MTKRKSGLPDDDHRTAGLTSLCNTVTGVDKRTAALENEEAIKRGQRYDTLTLTDLASWPTLVVYKCLSQRLKDHVFEHYMWAQLHANSLLTREQVNQAFDKINDHERDTLAEQLCDKHAVIEYTLRTQVLPEYIKQHTTGGTQTLHWQPLSPGSSSHKHRQRTVQRMNDMQANSSVPGATGQLLDFYGWRLDDDDTGMLHMLHRDLPRAVNSKRGGSGDDDEDDEADAATAITTSQSSRGIASAY